MESAPFIIVRGIPGSGKSTFAKLLKEKLDLDPKFVPCGTAIFETDNFFIDQIDRHIYRFNPKYLGIAHSWNQGEVIRFLRDCDPRCSVIVANTFCQNWEIKPYLEIAKDFNCKVYVFTLRTEHENVHGVPDGKVEMMRLGLQDFDMEKFAPSYPVILHQNVESDSSKDLIADQLVSAL